MKIKFLIIIFCTANTTYPQNTFWDLLRLFPSMRQQPMSKQSYPKPLRRSPLLEKKISPIAPMQLLQNQAVSDDACPCGHPAFKEEERCTCCGSLLKLTVPSPIELLKRFVNNYFTK